jgi:BASS family bile acid:Na+ symporter
VVGMGIVAAVPRVARWLARAAWVVFFAGIAVAAVLVLAKGAPVLLHTSPWALLAVVVVVAGSLLMGHLAGRPRLEDRSALAFMAVLGNPALGAAVIAESFPNFQAGALIAAYVIARGLAMLPYTIAVKRRIKHAAEREEGAPPRAEKPGTPGVLPPPAAVPGH